ncbi:MAG: zf-HC2 domain-containing protein [Planctomycetota bacterium]
MTDPNTLDCAQVSQRLLALLYDETDAAERSRLEGHLEHCAGCRAEWDAHRRTASFLDEWPETELPLDRPVPTVTALKRPPSWRRTMLVGAVAGGLVFLVLSLLSFEVRWSQDQLVLRLGGGEASQPEREGVIPTPQDLRQDFRELARAELRRQVQVLASDLDETFDQWDQGQQRRDAVLVSSLQRRYREDFAQLLERWEQSLEEARQRELRLSSAFQLVLERLGDDWR